MKNGLYGRVDEYSNVLCNTRKKRVNKRWHEFELILLPKCILCINSDAVFIVSSVKNLYQRWNSL